VKLDVRLFKRQTTCRYGCRAEEVNVSAFSDRIEGFVNEFDVDDLILRYDVDFDVPMRNEYALGILRMAKAFEQARGDDRAAVARRVGAHWCDIVRCDMVYDHWAALRLIEASAGDAAALLGAVREDPDAEPFHAYAAARWQDMTGKIRYRMGSYTRARIAFETAVEVGEQHRLWWALPDMRSNVHRGRYEESRLSGTPDIDRLIERLTTERDRIKADAPFYGVVIGDVDPEAGARHREYLRGYSSVLHNLALAFKDKYVKHGAEDHRKQSLATTRESIRISYVLGDQFRIFQSLNNQALLEPDRAPALFRRLADEPYVRGQLIARQQLARAASGMDAVTGLGKLLDDLIAAAREHGSTGIDVHIAPFTMDLYAKAVEKVLEDPQSELSAQQREDLTDGLAAKRFMMAESVRRVVAMPQYKQSYSKTIRPVYLQRIADRVASILLDSTAAAAGDLAAAEAEHAEEAFGLVEASSARELLDMLSTAILPELPALPTPPAGAKKRDLPAATEQSVRPELGASGDRAFVAAAGPDRRRALVRRGAVRRAGGATAEAVKEQLTARETQFEEAFARNPIEGTPADPEIAQRVKMFTVNNPDTCVVRYFTYGAAVPTRLGAFIVRHGEMRQVTGIDYASVERLAKDIGTDSAPTRDQCVAIWEILLAPVWDEIRRPDEPGHLVLIPTDDLFAVPLHLAWAPDADRPLAARLPMSQSVSATAFVTRGRSFLRRQPVSVSDHLAAIVVADDEARKGGRGVCGAELLDSDWLEERMIILGDRLPGLDGVTRHFRADTEGFREMARAKPEFFVYAGHGNFNPDFMQLGPYLELDDTVLTQYDIALRLRLPRNKLAVLGACLAGQGAKTDSGEVSGFLRSLIATGAGAIGMPLWSVSDGVMIRTVGALLAASRRAARPGGTGVFEPVQALYERYRHVAALGGLDADELIECLPFCLYL
jgi:tetratricopeptide (TPR) repeat protein